MDLVDREQGTEMTVDLEQQTITAGERGCSHSRSIPCMRHRLLNGLDDIGLTLQHEAEIDAYRGCAPGARRHARARLSRPRRAAA